MSLNLNPWLALFLGILIGWLLEWLLELWFFRRRRLECQGRLSQVEADLRTKEIELGNVRAHADSLQADLTALSSARRLDVKAVAPTLQAPVVKIEEPQVEVTPRQVEIEVPAVALPQVEVAAPKIEVEAPTAELPAVELPQVTVEAPEIAASLPEVTAPAVEIEAPEAALPAVALESGAELPAVEIATPRVELPEAGLAALAGVGLAGLAGEFEGEAPEVETRLVGAHIEMPELAIEAPEVVAPTVSAELPAVAVGLPDAALDSLQPIQVELPQVEAELPAVTLEAPQMEVVAPAVELPEAGLAAVAGLGLAGLGGALAGEAPQAERSVNWTMAPVEGETQIEGVALKGESSVNWTAAPAEPEAPRAEVRWPVVGDTVAEAGTTLPLAAELAAPSIGAELPAAAAGAAISAGLPDAAVEVTKPQVDERSVNWTAAPAAPPAIAGDDLEIIEGIGPVYAAKLRGAGITTFAQLAATDQARLALVVGAPSWRKTNYADWIAQARLAAAGDEKGLSALQEELFRRHGNDLDLIGGIGSRTADVLKVAGITSFALLAETTPEKLAAIVKKAGARDGDYQAWIAEARQRAANKRVLRLNTTRTVVKVASCPQDLSKLRGIGTVYEQKLYAAGIGTFWQLAEIAETDLAQILGAKDFQKVNPAEIKAAARRMAETTDTIGHTWDGSLPDDFEPLGGIGEVYEGRLYDAGICTYAALAAATVEQVAAICKAPAWRMPDYARWITQAAAQVARGK